MDRDRLAEARGHQLHAAFEGARDLPHEGDPVAVVGVHVGLDLEDEAGHLVAVGADLALFAGLRTRLGRIFGDRLDDLLDPEILQRRSEIDRRQVAIAIGLEIERRIALAAEQAFLGHARDAIGAEIFGEDRVFRALGLHGLAAEFLAVAFGQMQLAGLEVEHAFEQPAHADRPAHRRDVERQLVGDLVEQFERVAPFAVDLVDRA